MLILTLLLKNLKVILRTPLIIILLILIPILLMLVVGFSFSSETLNQVSIGLIEYKVDFFKFKNIELKKYNTGNFENSRNECVSDLKNSRVSMCVYFQEIYDSSGEFVNANIIYYIDNTRPKLSNILIENFDNYLESKTKEISKKTVSEIFIEIKNTVDFMGQSKNLIDELETNLSSARQAIGNLSDLYDTYIVVFNEYHNNFKLLSLELSKNVEMISINKIDLINNLNQLNNTIEENINSIYEKDIIIDKLIFQLEEFSKVSNLSDYMNISDLYYLKTLFKDLEKDLISTQKEISVLEENLNKIPLDQVQLNLDNLSQIFENLSSQLGIFKVQLDEFEKILIDKEIEVKNLNKQIGERLLYFENLSKKDASEITEPITSKKEFLFSKLKMVHQLAPSIVILVILFVGLLLSNVIVSLELNSKAYFRNLVSPVSQWNFFIALLLTSLIIILIQIFFLLIIMNFSFGLSNIISNIFPLMTIIVHILIIFILIGIFLGYFFDSIQVSILITTFIMLFLFLLSGIIVPTEVMPSLVAKLVYYNPVVIGEDIIRKIFFFNTFSFNNYQLISIYSYIILLLILIGYAFNRRKKRLF